MSTRRHRARLEQRLPHPPPGNDVPAFFGACPCCGNARHGHTRAFQTLPHGRPWQAGDRVVGVEGRA